MTVRVVLADDQALLRKGFRMILEAEDDIEIVGEAADGADAVRLVELYEPDVVLMDVRMPVLDGIEATRAITRLGRRDPRPHPHDVRPRRVRLQRPARRGQRIPAERRTAARAVSGHPHRGPGRRRGLAADHPATARGVRPQAARPLGSDDGRRQSGRRAARTRRLASLTEREREVLLAVADGLSNAEIAERLFVSEATVKSHVGRLLAKLGLRDRVQAVVFAFQTGLVRPS